MKQNKYLQLTDLPNYHVTSLITDSQTNTGEKSLNSCVKQANQITYNHNLNEHE